MTTTVTESTPLNQRPLNKVFSLTFCIFFIGCYATWTLVETNKHSVSLPLQQQTKFDEPTEKHKKILLWNSPQRIEAAAFGTGHQVFIDAQCPVNNCTIVANSSKFWNEMQQSNFHLLETFDAVLFSVHEMWLSSLPPPQYRRPLQQRFVLLTQESPQSMVAFDPEEFRNFFNWTMSYKLDSDVQLLYGRVHPKDPNQTEQVVQRNLNKTKKIAWMVSHCQTHSKREEYVKELKKYIQVDIYGACGDLKCTRNDSHWLSDPNCYVSLSNEYKFYLSFENSICKDYVTEKFFSILQHDLVPIVLGGADYKSIAPPHSYIDSAHFKTPAELAAYLLYLDGNDDLYQSYFDWKKQFSVEAGVEQMARHAFCDLCAKLNRPEEPSKVYTTLMPQWSAKTQCNDPKPIKSQLK